jgi:hypothetical protein
MIAASAGRSPLPMRHRPTSVVARPRPWDRSGLDARAHATGQWSRCTAAAPRAPSPARPHDLVLAGDCMGAGRSQRQFAPGCAGAHLVCGPGHFSAKSTSASARPRLWGRAGLDARGAAAVRRWRCPVACARAASHDRPRSLGLAAAKAGSARSKKAAAQPPEGKRREATSRALPSTICPRWAPPPMSISAPLM